jgi:predicted NUDIX family phosphoesterase
VSETRDDELVLCVRASRVRELFDGREWVVRQHALASLIYSLYPAVFVPRSICETDERQKQIIPYVVMTCRGKVYRYTRAGGEGRLLDRHSIGFGGHINPCDERGDGLARTICRAAYREVKEEIGGDGLKLVRENACRGLISDDSDPVGRVHLGALFVFDLISDDIEPKEAALSDGQWLTPAELWVTPNLESWSGIVVRNLFAEGGMIL